MKTNTNKEALKSECTAGRCQKILAQIAQAKNTLLGKFRDTLAGHEQVLRLALNEAEALAWQTRFPHLVFQDLAEEKTRAVMSWVSHQRQVAAAGA